MNLNSLDSKAVTNEKVWKEWLDALRVRLAARPNESLGVVIHRKMHPKGREFFRNEVAGALQNGGVSIEGEVALHFKSDRQYGGQCPNLLHTAWLATAITASRTWSFRLSNIMGGSITNLTPICTKHMIPLTGEGRGGDVSQTQRVQYFLANAYKASI